MSSSYSSNHCLCVVASGQQKGKRCSHLAKVGSVFCGHHEKCTKVWVSASDSSSAKFKKQQTPGKKIIAVPEKWYTALLKKHHLSQNQYAGFQAGTEKDVTWRQVMQNYSNQQDFKRHKRNYDPMIGLKVIGKQKNYYLQKEI